MTENITFNGAGGNNFEQLIGNSLDDREILFFASKMLLIRQHSTFIKVITMPSMSMRVTTNFR